MSYKEEDTYHLRQNVVPNDPFPPCMVCQRSADIRICGRLYEQG